MSSLAKQLRVADSGSLWYKKPGENMETTELRSSISELSARVEKIRDWL
jgi:hypothetical protein